MHVRDARMRDGIGERLEAIAGAVGAVGQAGVALADERDIRRAAGTGRKPDLGAASLVGGRPARQALPAPSPW